MQEAKKILVDIRSEVCLTAKYIACRTATERAFQSTLKERRQKAPSNNLFPNIGVLFVHIPKCGGTSIHQWLSSLEKATMEYDQSPLSSEKLRNVKVGKHAKAFEWRASLDDEVYKSLKKVCFIRNPWDLAVSSFFWWQQYAIRFPNALRDALIIRKMAGFDEFVRSPYASFKINEHNGSMETWFQAGHDDIVDHVIKIEEAAIEMPRIFATELTRTRRSEVTLPHENSTARGSYRGYYTEEAKDIIYDRHKYIIDRFGYTF